MMMLARKPSTWRVLTVALLTASAFPAPLALAACHDEGPGSSASNSSVGEFQYAGWLQTFIATDSILTQVSVWHTVPDTISGVSLYVGGMDSTGVADLAHPVAGPFVAPSSFGSSGGPAAMVYAIAPPLHLVLGHQYYFAVALPQPGSPAYVGLAIDSTGTAAAGSAWKWKFPFLPIQDGHTDPSIHVGDLIYSLEFCDDAVATSSRTWGEIKTHYR